MAQTLNNYFVNIVPLLKINYNIDFLTDTDNQEDPIQVIIEKIKSHSSILVINNKKNKNCKFGFALVTKDYVAFIIKNTDDSKTDQKNNVLTSIIAKNIDIFSDALHRNMNKCIPGSTFPDD